MHPLYEEMEATFQKKITQGWEDFNKSDQYEFCKEFHDFLWDQEEFTSIHRRRLPHAPYEYAARYLGIPFMNELIKLGLHMNTWFPGDFDIRDEYPDSSKRGSRHPGGRISHLILLGKVDDRLEKVCKVALEFVLRHQDVDNAFGFKEPKIEIIETYQENPEKFINPARLREKTEHYNVLGQSWAFGVTD